MRKAELRRVANSRHPPAPHPLGVGPPLRKGGIFKVARRFFSPPCEGGVGGVFWQRPSRLHNPSESLTIPTRSANLATTGQKQPRSRSRLPPREPWRPEACGRRERRFHL